MISIVKNHWRWHILTLPTVTISVPPSMNFLPCDTLASWPPRTALMPLGHTCVATRVVFCLVFDVVSLTNIYIKFFVKTSQNSLWALLPMVFSPRLFKPLDEPEQNQKKAILFLNYATPRGNSQRLRKMRTPPGEFAFSQGVNCIPPGKTCTPPGYNQNTPGIAHYPHWHTFWNRWCFFWNNL